MVSDNSKITFVGKKLHKIFHEIRVKENIERGPVVHHLGLEALDPLSILKEDTIAHFKVVNMKKYILAKLKYGF
jgi:hypothetical protein